MRHSDKVRHPHRGKHSKRLSRNCSNKVCFHSQVKGSQPVFSRNAAWANQIHEVWFPNWTHAWKSSALLYLLLFLQAASSLTKSSLEISLVIPVLMILICAFNSITSFVPDTFDSNEKYQAACYQRHDVKPREYRTIFHLALLDWSWNVPGIWIGRYLILSQSFPLFKPRRACRGSDSLSLFYLLIPLCWSNYRCGNLRKLCDFNLDSCIPVSDELPYVLGATQTQS